MRGVSASARTHTASRRSFAFNGEARCVPLVGEGFAVALDARLRRHTGAGPVALRAETRSVAPAADVVKGGFAGTTARMTATVASQLAGGRGVGDAGAGETDGFAHDLR